MRRRRTPYLFETAFIAVVVGLVGAPVLLVPGAKQGLQSTWHRMVGLSDSRVVDLGGSSNMALALGPEGRVWALEKYRLARFGQDGIAFDLLIDPRRRHELFRPRISAFASLHVDGNDSAWVGTWRGELLRYERGRWSVVLARKQPLRSRIHAICALGPDLLLATAQGAWRFDRRAQTASRIDALPTGVSRWCHNGVHARVAVGREIWRMDAGNWRREAQGRFNVEAGAVREDKLVAVIDRQGYAAVREGIARREAVRLPMQAVKPDSHGVWVGTIRHGLLLRTGRNHWLHANRDRGLANNHISDLLIDRQQRLWLAHYGAGITVVPVQKARAAMSPLGL